MHSPKTTRICDKRNNFQDRFLSNKIYFEDTHE